MDYYKSRRGFIIDSGILMGSLLPLGMSSSASTSGTSNNAHAKLLNFISTIPNFCTHEHWGSIQSIGEAPEQHGFRCDTTSGATPQRLTTVWDLFLDPYEEGWLHAGGKDPEAKAVADGYPDFNAFWSKNPDQALNTFKSLVGSSLLTGGFQCTRRGIDLLYQADLSKFKMDSWQRVNLELGNNYSDPFSWYTKAMAKAHFTELIRPVHPEFYVNQESADSRKKEQAFTHNVMRVDPLMDLWTEVCPRRNSLAALIGIEPADAQSWKMFITKLFDLAAANHALGIKQLQAYKRSLDYQPRSDHSIKFRGNLDHAEVLAFQDWVMHECCKQAAERKWAHQVHVGTHNLPSSDPLPLGDLAKRYPSMNIIMIHCWPFLKEAAFLAKLNTNMYLDTCWLPVLNPTFLSEAFTTWLNYVPAHKIMLGHDSTHVEMAAGSSLFTRELLTDALVRQQQQLKLSSSTVRVLAADMLQNNAVRLYRIGKIYNPDIA